MKVYVSKTKGLLKNTVQDFINPEAIEFQDKSTLGILKEDVNKLKEETKELKKGLANLAAVLLKI